MANTLNTKSVDLWSLQRQQASRLRRETIDYLRSGTGPVAVGFRSGIEHSDVKAEFNHFLDEQSKNHAWGTYIELEAWAEKNGYSVVVTAVDGNKESTWTLHRAENDDAPVVHMVNYGNSHWSYAGMSTIGDGNCLYNAMALAEYYIQHPQQQATETDSEAVANMNDDQVIQQQNDLFANYVKNAAKPSEIAAQQAAEQQRIASLPKHEQQQIAKDRIVAMQLARGKAQANQAKFTLPTLQKALSSITGNQTSCAQAAKQDTTNEPAISTTVSC